MNQCMPKAALSAYLIGDIWDTEMNKTGLLSWRSLKSKESMIYLEKIFTKQLLCSWGQPAATSDKQKGRGQPLPYDKERIVHSRLTATSSR